MEQKIRKILIAVDGSDFAIKAAKTGFTAALAFDAAVGLLFAIDPAKEVTNADLGITLEEREQQLRKKAADTLQTCQQQWSGDSALSLFTPTGLPEETILQVAESWQADLIVMGTHGRSAVGRILSGSKAEYVVRHARVPVLLISPRMR